MVATHKCAQSSGGLPVSLRCIIYVFTLPPAAGCFHLTITFPISYFTTSRSRTCPGSSVGLFSVRGVNPTLDKIALLSSAIL